MDNKKYGLVGERLGHTFSPMIHNEILKLIAICGTYHILEFEKDQVYDIVNLLKYQAYNGVNVTIPYKTEIMAYLDDISDEARKIGAVNTIKFIDNKSVGYNTDYYGFGMMLKHNNIKIENKTALILGTGGASRAVIQYLIDSHINRIILASTDVESAKTKYPDLEAVSYKKLSDIASMDLLINCTPVGMFRDKDNTPVNEDIISKFDIAVDIIYNPPETKLLNLSKRHGLKTVNGLYMLIAQAVKAQEIWNNISIDAAIIDEINNLLIQEL